MAIIHHDEHLLDRAAMMAMRGFMKLAPEMTVGPDGRAAYDALIQKTPTPDGVESTGIEIGGVSGGLCRPADAVPGRAVLFLHGGCYVLGSAAAYRGLASQLAARSKAAIFVADYRLAPEYPFPAAFDDACQAFDGMAAAGFDAVAVAGDSAGGGLALALLASGLATTKAVGAALFSPWIDLSLTGETMATRADADPTYSAIKAAIHSYTISLRAVLDGSIEVIELAPPAVRTTLTPGQENNERFMPLDDFIDQVMARFQQIPTPREILVEGVDFMRNADKENRSTRRSRRSIPSSGRRRSSFARDPRRRSIVRRRGRFGAGSARALQPAGMHAAPGGPATVAHPIPRARPLGPSTHSDGLRSVRLASRHKAHRASLGAALRAISDR